MKLPFARKRLDRELGLSALQDAMGRAQAPEPERLCTASGRVAHLLVDGRSLCPDMAAGGWDWDRSAGGRERAEGLPTCRRCEAARGEQAS